MLLRFDVAFLYIIHSVHVYGRFKAYLIRLIDDFKLVLSLNYQSELIIFVQFDLNCKFCSCFPVFCRFGIVLELHHHFKLFFW